MCADVSPTWISRFESSPKVRPAPRLRPKRIYHDLVVWKAIMPFYMKLTKGYSFLNLGLWDMVLFLLGRRMTQGNLLSNFFCHSWVTEDMCACSTRRHAPEDMLFCYTDQRMLASQWIQCFVVEQGARVNECVSGWPLSRYDENHCRSSVTWFLFPKLKWYIVIKLHEFQCNCGRLRPLGGTCHHNVKDLTDGRTLLCHVCDAGLAEPVTTLINMNADPRVNWAPLRWWTPSRLCFNT